MSAVPLQNIVVVVIIIIIILLYNIAWIA